MIRSSFIRGSLAATLLYAAAAASAQELPWPTGGTADVIEPDPPAAAAPAATAEPDPPPSPEESLDEAAEVLVRMLTADAPEGPPMAECAVDLLRTRLATAVEGDDVLTAIALENELLSLCNRRQQLVLEVLSTELLLASMIAGEAMHEAAAQAAAAAPVALQATPAAPTLDQIAAEAVTTTPEPEAEPAAPEPPQPASPGLAWVTVLGSAGNLRAAVSDGASVWWVREGDVLAGDWRVTRIAARPPGVTLSHAEAGHHALPFHSRPAPGSGDEP